MNGKIKSGMYIKWNTAAAAAAKSLQLCPTLCDPIDWKSHRLAKFVRLKLQKMKGP